MAERLCPDAVFVPPDFVRYKAVSQAVREIFQRHTELIEPLSLDEAYLDVTENKSGLPTATLVAKTIRQQIAQELNLTASAGIAPNKFTDGWCLSIVDAQAPFAKLWKAYGVGLTDERG
jgi:DNA polymerase IV